MAIGKQSTSPHIARKRRAEARLRVLQTGPRARAARADQAQSLPKRVHPVRRAHRTLGPGKASLQSLSNPHQMSNGAGVEGREARLDNANTPPRHPMLTMKGCSLSSAFALSSFTLHEVGKGMFCLPGGSNRILQCFCCPQYRVFCVFGT